MTRLFNNLLLFLAIAAAVVLVVAPERVKAVDYFWNAANSGYSTGSNWSPAGPPTLFDNAFINNAGAATLSTGSGEANVLELGSTAGGSGTFVVSGGEFTANDRIRIGEVGTGTATFSGGTVRTPFNEQDIFVGGENSGGTGTLTVSGATTSVNASDDFILGRVGAGTLNFSSGWITGGYTVVGKFGTGNWNQSGGVFEQSFGDVEIGDGGRPDQLGTDGPRMGAINLTGGVLQSTGHFAIGNRSGGGVVNVSGGALAMTGSAGDGSIIVGRGMDWDAFPGLGGATTLRVIGDDSRIIANGSLLMNTADVHASSTLVARITGPTHTTIKVAGDANISNGSFKVELDGFTPALGNSWTIVQAGADLTVDKAAITTLAASLTSAPSFDGLQHSDPAAVGSIIGMFENEDFSQAVLPAGLQWDVEYSANAVLLKVVGAPGRTGDYNANGTVDAADYALWRDKLNQNVTLPNDSTPGTVTMADYDVWRANFGRTPASGLAAAVPEPTSMILLLTACFASIGCCRRRVH